MSKVVGISMVKDEMDILPLTLKHMAGQVDCILLYDDSSSDGTYEWLRDEWVNGSEFYLISNDGGFREGYYQSEKMTVLAHIAQDRLGASWVVPFDADEFWTSQWGTIKEVCENNEDTYGIVTANLYDHMETGKSLGTNPIDRMCWRRVVPLPAFKVACRTDPTLIIDQGNHNARYPVPARRTEEAGIVVHHYPYRSHEQFIRKVRNGSAAYAKTDLPESYGDHWRKWGKFTDEQLIELFDKYYYVEDPTKPYMLDDVEQPALYKDPFNVR